MADFPADNTFDVPATLADFDEPDFAAAMQALLEASRQYPGGQPATKLEIAAGVLTPTRGIHTVDTEAGAATDYLTSIATTNMRDGAVIILEPYDADNHVVTIQHGTALQLANGANFVMDTTYKKIKLRRSGAVWYEVWRAGGDVAARGQQWIAASGNFTVPAGITTIWYSMAPGGGGGGGGGGSGSGAGDGASGSAGGSTDFGGDVIFGNSGGGGGFGGGVTGNDGRGGSAQNTGQHGGDSWGIQGGRGGLPAIGPLGIYGRGGKGGTGAAGTNPGGGGASGDGFGTMYIRKPKSVTGGQVIAVTIGAGGAGGAGGTAGSGGSAGSAGQAGQAGAVLVEW